ncbi:hypothetical protein GCK72_004244 [Caenorhabditis remanei]|uniref:Uncharacterized protein n=1 Tax=Caenorhabditis remanei TaxID=31234 RepID=A0A6A5HAX5_CAERE|nr:hypothetical protein GCK72_004244 [Caenorhabditis remanei]KAF1764297.1 hypothetical protein GCK72_004244 [Caenorhabditis remanei]
MTLNSSCASQVQVDHLSSTNYRLAATLALIAVLLTFILSITAVTYMSKKSIFQSATRRILIFNILFANLHQVMYAIFSKDMLSKGLYKVDEPCDWLVSERDCVPYTVLLYTGITGMILSQTGVLIERAYATFHPQNTSRIRSNLAVLLIIVVLPLSMYSYPFILLNDPLDGFILTCFIPAAHSAHRANMFLFICLVVTVLNFVASVALKWYNKKLEYSYRFILDKRFKQRQAIESTLVICDVTLSQFITSLIYSLGVFILRMYIGIIPLSTFYSLIVWVYTVPYTACLLPLILLIRMASMKMKRKRKIQDTITPPNKFEEHFSGLKKLWDGNKELED